MFDLPSSPLSLKFIYFKLVGSHIDSPHTCILKQINFYAYTFCMNSFYIQPANANMLLQSPVIYMHSLQSC